jgi:hypothetical protein
MRNKILIGLAVGAVAAAVGFIANTASAGSSTSVTDPTIVDDSSIHPSTTTVGGASVLPTTRTVAHFFGSSVNPNDGVKYGFNMVGADPNNCRGGRVHFRRCALQRQLEQPARGRDDALAVQPDR